MKRDDQKQREKWVLESLKKAGYQNVHYGDDPPDLLLNDTIAIEVSSLVEHAVENGKRKPVKSASSAFRELVEDVVKEFPNNDNSPSAYINYVFFRPLPVSQTSRKMVRKVLRDHLPFLGESKEYILDGMEFDIGPSSTIHETKYVLFGMQDGNRGVSSLATAMEELPYVLKEKELILKGYGSMYNENWLALIDETAYPINDSDLSELRNSMNLTSTFDKILLFTPYNHFHFNTLYNKSGLF